MDNIICKNGLEKMVKKGVTLPAIPSTLECEKTDKFSCF